MTDYIVNGADLTSIANKIRAKGQTSASIVFPGGFADAIDNLPDAPVLETLSVTENGNYTPGTGVDGFSSVSVNVSGGGGVSGLILGVGNITASSVYGYVYLAEKAPGHEVKNMWGANGAGSEWWQVEFYTPQVIKSVKFAPYLSYNGAIFWSATVVLQASNDLSTWDNLLTLSDMPQSNDQLTYALANTTAYRYYRFVCQSGSTYYTGLGKIQMYV